MDDQRIPAQFRIGQPVSLIAKTSSPPGIVRTAEYNGEKNEVSYALLLSGPGAAGNDNKVLKTKVKHSELAAAVGVENAAMSAPGNEVPLGTRVVLDDVAIQARFRKSARGRPPEAFAADMAVVRDSAALITGKKFDVQEGTIKYCLGFPGVPGARPSKWSLYRNEFIVVGPPAKITDLAKLRF